MFVLREIGHKHGFEYGMASCRDPPPHSYKAYGVSRDDFIEIY